MDAAVPGYTETALDHFRNPRGVGSLPEATGVGKAGNPDDGDHLRLALIIDGNRLVRVRFQTFGCPAAIAAGSAATELLEGRTVEEALSLTNDDVVAALGGLPEHKLGCSVLAAEALRAAVEDHYTRRGERAPV